MSNANDFIIENGVLKKYSGVEGDIVLPDDVTAIGEGAFIGYTCSTIHISRNVQAVCWNISDPAHPFEPHGTFGLNTTICAPTGSVVEREVNLKRTQFGYRFVPEGEPVEPDDSHVRCDRSFNDWRKYFNFSNRAKGSHVSVYLRSAKLVYLPDKFGKPDVASIEKDAFPKDTAVLCSKRLFAKLAEANKLATVFAFLSDTTPFFPDEAKYLKDYIKKNSAVVFEALIQAEDTAQLQACLEHLKYADAVVDVALEPADRLNRTDIKAFLLECKNNTAAK